MRKSLEMLPEQVRRAVEDFVAALHQRYGDRVLNVRLYGSYARGEPGPQSDVDLFVHLANTTYADQKNVFECAADVALKHLVVLQVFVPQDNEYNWLTQNECRIMRDIQAEGWVL